jgi:hypothetical protein
MAMGAPPARIGRTTGARPRPQDSEKLPRGAKFHTLSELRSGDVTRIPPAPKRKPGK